MQGMDYRFINTELVERERSYWRYPGVTICAFDEESEEIYCTGTRKLGEELPFNRDTMFTIASCSKSMTAALIARLVAEGVLDFDRPVSSYIPEFQMWDEEATAKMSLRDMLCHNTGFGAYDVLWPAVFSREEMARNLRYIEPTDSFRSGRSLYSNVIYALIGYVAEAVTGKSWPQLMEEYIFRPLGMNRTNCLADEIKADANHAEPHFFRAGGVVTVPYWNVDQAGPAASVNSTPTDMLKWLRFHMAGGRLPDGTQLIPEALFREMHTEQAHFPETLTPPHPDYHGGQYCMGWRRGFYKGHEIQKHTGKIEGYSTLQLYLPAEKKGILIMVNFHSPTAYFFNLLTYETVNRMLGIEEDLSHLYHEAGTFAPAEEYRDSEVDVAAKRLPEAECGCALKYENKAITGTYVNRGFGYVNIYEKAEDGSLFLHYRDQDLLLQPWGGAWYFMEGVKADTLTMRIPVRFEVSPDGDRVNRVYIGYEPELRDVLFMKTV